MGPGDSEELTVEAAAAGAVIAGLFAWVEPQALLGLLGMALGLAAAFFERIHKIHENSRARENELLRKELEAKRRAYEDLRDVCDRLRAMAGVRGGGSGPAAVGEAESGAGAEANANAGAGAGANATGKSGVAVPGAAGGASGAGPPAGPGIGSPARGRRRAGSGSGSKAGSGSGSGSKAGTGRKRIS